MGHWGIQPSEFWRMSVREFMWLSSARAPQASSKWAGSLTDDDMRELTEVLRTHG